MLTGYKYEGNKQERLEMCAVVWDAADLCERCSPLVLSITHLFFPIFLPARWHKTGKAK